jgi:RimJ/RimL family protein N-acetyltransferase
MTTRTRKAPERIETARLILRRPRVQDAEEVFARYASDREVSRYLAWRLHESPATTRAFLEFSDAEWERWPAGPYLVESREDGRLLGGSGFAFETPYRASTGYVFARDAWGQGYATEALLAEVEVAWAMGVVRLYAVCHVDHVASTRVLEKARFRKEGVLQRYLEFPNLDAGGPADVWCYSRIFDRR